MAWSGRDKLGGVVQVDETLDGGEERGGKTGRRTEPEAAGVYFTHLASSAKCVNRFDRNWVGLREAMEACEDEI